MKTNKRYTLKNFVWLMKNLTSCRFDCPYCTPVSDRDKDPYSSSVAIKYLWDEQYHKYKFFAKCKHVKCKYVTPAFDNINAVVDHMEYDWTLKTDKLLLTGQEDKVNENI